MPREGKVGTEWRTELQEEAAMARLVRLTRRARSTEEDRASQRVLQAREPQVREGPSLEMRRFPNPSGCPLPFLEAEASLLTT
jgi:hypothetical protein